jgi:hypothetical protein
MSLLFEKNDWQPTYGWDASFSPREKIWCRNIFASLQSTNKPKHECEAIAIASVYKRRWKDITFNENLEDGLKYIFK